MTEQENLHETEKRQTKKPDNWKLATQGEYVKFEEDEEVKVLVSNPELVQEEKEFDGNKKQMWTLKMKVHEVNGEFTGQNKLSNSSRDFISKMEKYVRPLEGNESVLLAIMKTGKAAATKYFVRKVD